MSLVPSSISCNVSESLYKTLGARLDNMNSKQLVIDIENELNTDRLQLILDMFGIELSGINFLDFTPIQKRDFIKKYIEILRFSGTPKSIVSLCLAIGATAARLECNWQLLHNSEAMYNGAQRYDSGRQYKQYAIDVIVTGVPDMDIFRTRFMRIFRQTQPARIYVRNIIKE